MNLRCSAGEDGCLQGRGGFCALPEQHILWTLQNLLNNPTADPCYAS